MKRVHSTVPRQHRVWRSVGFLLSTATVLKCTDRSRATNFRSQLVLNRKITCGEPSIATHDESKDHVCGCVVNYAEALVKPAEADDTLQRAVDAIASSRIALHEPDAAIARAAARKHAVPLA
jgi:hypothetical protein